MTLDRLRPLATRVLDPLVVAADRVGATPDSVSVVAFALALGAGGAFYLGPRSGLWYLLGAFLVFLNGWLDLLDGALARHLGTESDAGDLLDHVLDRYADIAMLVGLAAGVGQWALGLAAVTGVLMTSYLGTQAEAVGLERVYGGLVGRADRLAVIGLATAVAAFVSGRFAGLTVVGWVLVFFAVVGHVTAIQRFYHSMRALA